MFSALKSAVRPAAPPLSPARAELAAAIERHANAVRQLAANEQATSAAHQLIWDEEAAVERQQAALEEANANAARHLTDVVMGVAGVAQISIRDARAELADAIDELAETQGALEALLAQRKPAEDEVGWSRDFVLKPKLAAVVGSSPNVAKLLSEFASLQRELAARRGVLNFIASKFAIPDEHRRWDAERYYPSDAGGIALWAAAFVALETDADASLPS